VTQPLNPPRTLYSYGQLLGVEDFGREQAYHSGLREQLTSLLYGPGTLAGLGVTFFPGQGVPEKDGVAPALIVEPGVGLDGRGRLIILSQAATSRGIRLQVVPGGFALPLDDPALVRTPGVRPLDLTLGFREEASGQPGQAVSTPVLSLVAPDAGGDDLVLARISLTVTAVNGPVGQAPPPNLVTAEVTSQAARAVLSAARLPALDPARFSRPLQAAEIESVTAAQVTGVLNPDRIPALPAAKILDLDGRDRPALTAVQTLSDLERRLTWSPGVLFELEVADGAELASFVIKPGVAIGPDGRLILLGSRARLDGVLVSAGAQGFKLQLDPSLFPKEPDAAQNWRLTLRAPPDPLGAEPEPIFSFRATVPEPQQGAAPITDGGAALTGEIILAEFAIAGVIDALRPPEKEGEGAPPTPAPSMALRVWPAPRRRVEARLLPSRLPPIRADMFEYRIPSDWIEAVGASQIEGVLSAEQIPDLPMDKLPALPGALAELGAAGRHRLLFTPGVLRGLEVREGPSPGAILVSPGLGFDGLGRSVVLSDRVLLDGAALELLDGVFTVTLDPTRLPAPGASLRWELRLGSGASGDAPSAEPVLTLTESSTESTDAESLLLAACTVATSKPEPELEREGVRPGEGEPQPPTPPPVHLYSYELGLAPRAQLSQSLVPPLTADMLAGPLPPEALAAFPVERLLGVLSAAQLPPIPTEKLVGDLGLERVPALAEALARTSSLETALGANDREAAETRRRLDALDESSGDAEAIRTGRLDPARLPPIDPSMLSRPLPPEALEPIPPAKILGPLGPEHVPLLAGLQAGQDAQRAEFARLKQGVAEAGRAGGDAGALVRGTLPAERLPPIDPGLLSRPVPPERIESVPAPRITGLIAPEQLADIPAFRIVAGSRPGSPSLIDRMTERLEALERRVYGVLSGPLLDGGQFLKLQRTVALGEPLAGPGGPGVLVLEQPGDLVADRAARPGILRRFFPPRAPPAGDSRFTIQALVRAASLSEDQPIVFCDYPGPDPAAPLRAPVARTDLFTLLLRQGALTLRIHAPEFPFPDPPVELTTRLIAPLGAWALVSLTWDPGFVALHLNGAEVGRWAMRGVVPAHYRLRFATDGQKNFKGAAAWFALWSEARAAAEIAATPRRRFLPAEISAWKAQGLRGYWPLDGLEGLDAPDLADGGNSGRLTRFSAQVDLAGPAVKAENAQFQPGPGISYNTQYGGWSFSSQTFQVTFTLPGPPTSDLVLGLLHCTSSQWPADGYSPVDIDINATRLRSKYDPAEANRNTGADTKNYIYDQMVVPQASLVAGLNTLRFTRQPGRTNYWIRLLQVGA
jgi:hypothetical protein